VRIGEKLRHLVCLYAHLACVATAAVAGNAIEESFLDDCRAIASKGGLQIIAVLPSAAPLSLKQMKASSWEDEADLFSLKWRVTYEVVNGYLIVGDQFADVCCSRSHKLSDSLEGPPQESGLSFVQSLSEAQLASMRETGGLPFSLLSPQQCEQLTNLLRAFGNKRIGAVNPQRSGYISLQLYPCLTVYSNGRPLGTIWDGGPKKGFEYNDWETEEQKKPAVTPSPATAVIQLSTENHRVTVPDFVRVVTGLCKPSRQVVLHPHVEQDRRTIYCSNDQVPFSVGWAFVTRSLDLEVRELPEVRYVSFARTLPNEVIERENSEYSKRRLDRIISAFPAAVSATTAGECYGMRRRA